MSNRLCARKRTQRNIKKGVEIQRTTNLSTSFVEQKAPSSCELKFEWEGRGLADEIYIREILLPETTIIILLIFREHNDNITGFSILSFERNYSLEIIVMTK